MFCVWVSSLSYDQFTWLWMIVFADFSGLVQLIDSEELVDTQSSTARVLVLLKAFFQAIWYQGFMFLIFTSKTFLKRRGGGVFHSNWPRIFRYIPVFNDKIDNIDPIFLCSYFQCLSIDFNWNSSLYLLFFYWFQVWRYCQFYRTSGKCHAKMCFNNILFPAGCIIIAVIVFHFIFISFPLSQMFFFNWFEFDVIILHVIPVLFIVFAPKMFISNLFELWWLSMH